MDRIEAIEIRRPIDQYPNEVSTIHESLLMNSTLLPFATAFDNEIIMLALFVCQVSFRLTLGSTKHLEIIVNLWVRTIPLAYAVNSPELVLSDQSGVERSLD